ncbi:MAG: DUF4854 domain-containing protein [Lachnospiraceae bacterium]|nr:DUF4854 domain-containing protein [Lachnospiraceae bacterium]
MKKLVSLLLVAVMSLSLMACGDKNFADSYKGSAYESSLNEQFSSMKDMFEGLYTDISVGAEGDSLVYKYYYDAAFDNSDVVIDENDLLSTVDDVKKEIEASIGVAPKTVKFVYYNADGSVFFEAEK